MKQLQLAVGKLKVASVTRQKARPRAPRPRGARETGLASPLIYPPRNDANALRPSRTPALHGLAGVPGGGVPARGTGGHHDLVLIGTAGLAAAGVVLVGLASDRLSRGLGAAGLLVAETSQLLLAASDLGLLRRVSFGESRFD